MKRILLVISFWFFALGLMQAQDPHFSQFHSAPLHLNPALTGEFIGPFRAGLVYRNQWGALEQGYTTYAVGLDARFESKKRNVPSKMAAGLIVLRDKAGMLNYGRIQTLMSFAYRVIMNERHSVNLGLQGGFGTFRIDEEGLEWGNQYNGTQFDPEIQGEGLAFISNSFTDFSLGFNYHYGIGQQTLSSADERYFDIGFSAYHLSRPKINGRSKVEELLEYRYNYYGFFHIGLKNINVALEPKIVYTTQAEDSEVLVGNMFVMTLQEGAKVTGYTSAIHFGLGFNYRWGDAAIPMVMFRSSAYSLTISYDANVSSLRNSTGLSGGPEISFKYTVPE